MFQVLSVDLLKIFLWLVHFERQTSCPFWGTNKLPFLRDKQHSPFDEQTGFPFWGTNRLPFLRDKQNCLFGGINKVSFLRDKLSSLFLGTKFLNSTLKIFLYLQSVYVMNFQALYKAVFWKKCLNDIPNSSSLAGIGASSLRGRGVGAPWVATSSGAAAGGAAWNTKYKLIF